jgi:hypothetical protein
MEGLLRIPRQNLNWFLRDYLSGIDASIYPMNRCPGLFRTSGKCISDSMRSWKKWQEGGVAIDNFKSACNCFWQDSHKASTHH